MSRQALKVRYGHLYRIMGKIGDPCVYCGIPADSTDHIPPLKALLTFGTDYFRSMGVAPCTVASCLECNSTLSAKSLWWIQDRCESLLKTYKKRYFDLLDMPRWRQHELEELSGSLRVYVEEKSMLRELMVRRIERLREGFRADR